MLVLLLWLSGLGVPAQKTSQSAVLDAPVTEETAVSFFWIGDLDSHWRDPIDFYTVADTDRRLHTVEMAPAANPKRQPMAFIKRLEMQRLIEGVKSLGLHWVDIRRKEVLRDYEHRDNSGFLDITVVSSKASTKSHIRIARMCDQLATLDSTMPSPRILWQFQTFRWDNGCKVPGYHNEARPE